VDLKLFSTVFVTIFVAELGDKTQLATLLYASDASHPKRTVFLASAAALVLTRVLTSQLYGVSPTDPVTFVLVALVLAFVAIGASALPARRATRIEPMEALRHE